MTENPYQPTGLMKKFGVYKEKLSTPKMQKTMFNRQKAAKMIRKDIVPQVISRAFKDSEPLPSTFLTLYKEEVSNKLLSFDRKHLSEHERRVIASNIHFKRQQLIKVACKFYRSESSIRSIESKITGSSYFLPDWAFTFSDEVIPRGIYKQRTFSFPNTFYGANSLYDATLEYSTITDYYNSEISWFRSLGLSNPSPFTMYTDLEEGPAFWRAVAYLSTAGMRFASANWFYAVVELLDRSTCFPDGMFIRDPIVPPKPVYRRNETPGLFLEAFCGIYVIDPDLFIKGYRLFVEKPYSFLLWAAGITQRPDIDTDLFLGIVSAEDLPPPCFSGKKETRFNLTSILDRYIQFHSRKDHLCVVMEPSNKIFTKGVQYVSGPTSIGKLVASMKKVDVVCQWRELFGDLTLTTGSAEFLSEVIPESIWIDFVSAFPPTDRFLLTKYRTPEALVPADLFFLSEVIKNKKEESSKQFGRRMTLNNFFNSDLFPVWIAKRCFSSRVNYSEFKAICKNRVHLLDSDIKTSSSYSFKSKTSTTSYVSNGISILSEGSKIMDDPEFDVLKVDLGEDFIYPEFRLDEYTSDVRYWYRPSGVYRRGIG